MKKLLSIAFTASFIASMLLFASFMTVFAQDGNGGVPQMDAATQTLYTIISFVVSIISIIAMWKIFSKAGQPGWAAIIPIYNIIVLLRICNRPWWWLILLIIPIVDIVIVIILCIDLAKAFGHGIGFGLGLIFLSLIFLLILAFGSSRYVGIQRS